MGRMRPPKIPETPPRVLTDAELRGILEAWDGPTFEDRRDTALIRVFLDTGARRWVTRFHGATRLTTRRP